MIVPARPAQKGTVGRLAGARGFTGEEGIEPFLYGTAVSGEDVRFHEMKGVAAEHDPSVGFYQDVVERSGDRAFLFHHPPVKGAVGPEHAVGTRFPVVTAPRPGTDESFPQAGGIHGAAYGGDEARMGDHDEIHTVGPAFGEVVGHHPGIGKPVSHEVVEGRGYQPAGEISAARPVDERAATGSECVHPVACHQHVPPVHGTAPESGHRRAGETVGHAVEYAAQFIFLCLRQHDQVGENRRTGVVERAGPADAGIVGEYAVIQHVGHFGGGDISLGESYVVERVGGLRADVNQDLFGMPVGDTHLATYSVRRALGAGDIQSRPSYRSGHRVRPVGHPTEGTVPAHAEAVTAVTNQHLHALRPCPPAQVAPVRPRAAVFRVPGQLNVKALGHSSAASGGFPGEVGERRGRIVRHIRRHRLTLGGRNREGRYSDRFRDGRPGRLAIWGILMDLDENRPDFQVGRARPGNAPPSLMNICIRTGHESIRIDEGDPSRIH